MCMFMFNKLIDWLISSTAAVSAWYCRLSARLSVTKYCGANGRYHRAAVRPLPVHFFSRFCCRMYGLETTHSEKPNRRNFRASQFSRGHLIMAIFGGSVLQLYRTSGPSLLFSSWRLETAIQSCTAGFYMYHIVPSYFTAPAGLEKINSD